MLGYPDDAILRRAALHVPPQDAAALVDLVHAQRRRFDIIRPCSPEYRPLQPGGDVLPGDTPHEQDAAFGQQLRDMGVAIETEIIRDVDDAQHAWDQVRQLDLRTLKIGIPLPRWTEDGFNGDVHHDVNDYMPPLGSPPYDPDGWYAIVDEYIDEPTDERFFAMLERLEEESNTDEFEAQFDDDAPNCKYKTAAGYLVTLNRNKRRSQQVVQHLFRRSLLAGEQWPEIGEVPLRGYAEQYGEPLNPFFQLGGNHIEPICYPSTDGGKVANERIIASFPDDFREEVPAEDLQTLELRKLPKQLVHPWMTLGQIYDPALLMREDAAANKLHYWHLLSFVHDGYHDPFFTLHRVATQGHYFTELRDTDEHPGEVSHYGRFATHPLLDAGRHFLSEFARNFLSGDDPRAIETHRIKLNVMRTALLLMREHLMQGEAVREPNNMPFEHFRRYLDKLEGELSKDHGPAVAEALGGETELYVDDTRALIDEVQTLVAAAPVVE